MPFTNQREIYNALMGKHNKVRKQTDFSEKRGYSKTLTPGEEWTAINNFEFDKGTASWYLTITEFNRPASEVVTNLEVEIAFSNNPDGFDGATGGHETTYKQLVTFSEFNEYNKGAVVPHSTGAGSTAIIGGELVNMVHGRYMRVIIRNKESNPSNFVIKGPFLTEEGWY